MGILHERARRAGTSSCQASVIASTKDNLLWLASLLSVFFIYQPLFQDSMGKSAPERLNQSEFQWSKRRWVGSGISWTICKSLAPHFRQITTPAPHRSFFTGRMLFLASNQQCQSTKGNLSKQVKEENQGAASWPKFVWKLAVKQKWWCVTSLLQSTRLATQKTSVVPCSVQHSRTTSRNGVDSTLIMSYRCMLAPGKVTPVSLSFLWL